MEGTLASGRNEKARVMPVADTADTDYDSAQICRLSLIMFIIVIVWFHGCHD